MGRTGINPPPVWARVSIDFTNGGDSHSVWVGDEYYQYHQSTEENIVMDEPDWVEDWNIDRWIKSVSSYPYYAVHDLMPIKENE